MTDTEPTQDSDDLPRSENSGVNGPVSQFDVVTFDGHQQLRRQDEVVVEEPLEIRIVFGAGEKRAMRSVSITMRTPGNDHELAAGFLLSESILTAPSQISNIQSKGVDSQGKQTGNIVRVDVADDAEIEIGRLQRHFFTTSSCGVCGKASLEALEIQGLQPISTDSFSIGSKAIRQLSEELRQQQTTFNRTGGLHGAGMFDGSGKILTSREDIGRHNAVDKLIGRSFLDGQTPLSKYGMIVSGRVSFEIMQKALAAGVPMIVAVGAPSSLAIEMAQQYKMTLIGFASADRFNVYANEFRVT